MQELQAVNGASAEVEISAAQKRTKVFKHPERRRLEALLRRGKSAEWITLWLEEEYPLEDDEGHRHPEARIHEKLQLDPKDIESYRSDYLPEFAQGFDLLTGELEDAIGRRFPPPQDPVFETEVVEAGIRAAEINLARGLAADAEMEMVQPTTLQAQAQLMDAASMSVDIKARLGVPGYEPPPERLEVSQTTRSMSIELQGQVDPQTGEIIATEPKKVQLLEQLMALPPERATEVIAAAKATNPPVLDAEIVEERGANADAPGVIDSPATEIPTDEELDGGEGQTRGDAGEDRRGQSGDPQ